MSATTYVSYKAFAEEMGVPHGTVKRWALEGLPVERDTGKRCFVLLEAARAWCASRRPHSASYFTSSTIYFAQRLSDGAIKIGWTRDIERRLRELRKDSGSAVVFLAGVPGEKPDELRLHARFAAHRIDGEWFACEGSVAAFIDTLGSIHR